MAYSIVQSAVQKLGTLLVTEAGNLYEVRDKVESLQRGLIRMKFFLQDAENRGHQEAHVRQWVAEIRDIAYEAEDIIERYVHEVSHHRESGICNTLKWLCCLFCDACTLHEVGSNIDRLRAWIKELSTWAKIYQIQIDNQSESSKHSVMQSQQKRTYAHVVGLEKEEKEVVDKLVKTQLHVIVIHGMGGLGKTTFTRKVYFNKATEKHFDRFAWVDVSKNVQEREVFEEILSQLDDQDARRKIKELTDRQLDGEIRKVLSSKKCLVVLDDIWNIGARELLEQAFGLTERTGSKILLTTRKKELLEDARVDWYQLRGLNEKEAWTLLQQTAFPNEDDTMESGMEAPAKRMLNHCDGLPLAIVTLGGVLATKKTTEEWKHVQERITSYLTREGGEGSGSLSSVLELSFYDLPFYLKPCFLYLVSFPENYEISAERLYFLWEAEGIISSKSYDEARNQGVPHVEIAQTYLNELVNRNMVQVEKRWPNVRIESCRLHDVMRDVFLKKCMEVNFLSVAESVVRNNPSSCIASSFMENKRIRRCAIHQWQNPERMQSVASCIFCAKYLENTFIHHLQRNAHSLRSLFVFSFEDNVHDGTNFFSSKVKKFSKLRVLHLEGCIMHNILKVIGGVIHLRYLSLKGSDFRKLPSCIFDLKYLETLVLESGDDDVMLLPNKFWKMERLKHLYLPKKFQTKGSKKLTIGSSGRQQSQMETLKNFDPKKCQMVGLLPMENLRIFSFNEDYVLEDNEVWKVLLQSPLMKSCQLMNCLKLRIDAKIINEDPNALTSPQVKANISSLEIRGTINNVESRHFPRGLIRLKLDGCNISEEGVLKLEELSQLQELVLVNNAVSGDKMSISDGGFAQLISLQVELRDLKEWKLGKQALPNLRDLKINGCSDDLVVHIGNGALPICKMDIRSFVTWL